MTVDSHRDKLSLEKRSATQRLTIALLAVIQVLVTFLPELGLGERIGDRSDDTHTLITPAGWTFSIWGLLYAGSLAYAAFQWLPAQRSSGLADRIGWASAGAFAGNAIWALYVQFAALDILSAVIIIFTLMCLLSIYRVFSRTQAGFTRGEQVFVVLPLSALTAWLTAATIVNIAAVLSHYGVEAGDAAPAIGASTILAAGVIAGVAIWNGHGNPWFALIFLWALAGIHGANAHRYGIITIALAISAVAVVAPTLARLAYREERRRWLEAAGPSTRTRSGS
jgi:hypothetical protein